MATLPKIVGYEKTPRGKTVRDIVPGLEMVLPPTSDEMWEFPYLGRRRVVAKSTIRAAYSEMANEIGRGANSDIGDSANETLERRAQMQLALGTNVDNRSLPAHQMDHVFYTEFWLRRSAFFQLDDEKVRDRLLEMFPEGCYVALADALMLEARTEKMDDHWRICHALPGPGQIREPIGGSLVQIQEIVNDIVNMIRDTIEFTMSITFADQDVIDLRQMARAANAAGMIVPVTRKAGRPISEAFHQTQPGQLQPFAISFLNDLRTTWAQFATGAFPAAYGGGTPGNSALDVDTPIPTPGGFVRNGDLQDGDEVFGEDGKVYDVVKAHPVYIGESYRVTFDDGSEVVADGKHRWRTFDADERMAALNAVRPSVKGKWSLRRKHSREGSIRTTKEIADTLLDRRGRSNHATPVALPFVAPEAKLPIDPYVLGAWLGDGAAASGSMFCSDEDGPAMAAEFAKAGIELRRLKSPYTWYAQGLRKQLRLAGVLGEKRIPDAYLWASAKQRLALLQGLMDTDGCATKDGKQFFSNRNRNLVDGVFHLAASLGAKPRILEMTTGACVDQKTGTVYEGGKPIWLVRWTSPLDAFRLERKRARLKKTTSANKRKYRYIVSVERVNDRAVRCITVSNPTELYQFGKQFGVCANTAQGIETERNAALGRISLFLRALTEHWLSCAPIVIKDFRENGMEPVTIVDKAPAGDYTTDTVSPEELEVGNAKTMPELNEEYPVTWPQRQAALLQMFQNPLYQSMLAMISNAGEIKRTLGHELKVPGEDAYEFQHKLIRQLLEQAPVPGPMIPVMLPQDPNALVPDPATGQMVPAPPQQAIDEFGQPMMQPGPMLPSIQPQRIEDHLSMLQACIDFYYSEEAQAHSKKQDTSGWQNFMLHAAARQAAAMEQMQMMPPAASVVPIVPVPVSVAQDPQELIPPPMPPGMPPGMSPEMLQGLPPGLLQGLMQGGAPQGPPADPAMAGQAAMPGPLPM
jgi:hypothetical protein